MINKLIKRVIAIMIMAGLLVSTIGIVTSNAASISINTTKYPGYQDLINSILAKHPNWKITLKYTGLEWNAAIYGEYQGHGTSPSSLIPASSSYDGEWICSRCGANKYYDTGSWRCASEKAIAYTMDPRNYLTESSIFQFQELSSSTGDKASLKKMAGTKIFAQDIYLDAILEASKKTNVNPYHILSRIIQEQGQGTGPLANGTGYNGQYVGVYNLFNVGASGSSKEQVILNGLKYAATNGWTTIEKSIEGGISVIKNSYINAGQSTLYFQKFNVVNKNNLYGHQYMQNIFAPQSEASTIYSTYKSAGILNGDFEFTIPVYENMPKTVSEKPLNSSEPYSAGINSEMIELKYTTSNGNYLVGKAVIVEWLNGISTVPRKTPKITLKSTDGTVEREAYVNQIGGNTYYFDRNINGLDNTKTYYFELESGSSANSSPQRKKNMTMDKANNTTLGIFNNKKMIIENDKLVFTVKDYSADINTELQKMTYFKNTAGTRYISGEVVIVEWLDGKTSTVPPVMPKMTFKSTDGKVSRDCYVSQISGNTYYFDRNMEDLEEGKTYYFEVTSGASNNLSNKKTQKMNIGTKSFDYGIGYLLTTSGTNMTLKENGYYADINSEIWSMNYFKTSTGARYISGEIVIVEWNHGKISTVPKVMPKMTLKSTDGKVSRDCYVSQIRGNSYYFDRNMEDLDMSKTYYIELTSGSKENTSPLKTQKVNFGTRTLGNYGNNYDIVTSTTNITFKSNTYSADINSEILKLNVNKTTNGNYLIANAVIVEWVNGKTSTVPKVTPKITLKSTDGTVAREAYVKQSSGNTYYFDRNIDGLDTSKTYYLELTSGASNNTSTKKTIKMYQNNATLGKYGEYTTLWSNNTIMFKK